ncbi:MAG: TonB-dependent receptor [Acidobacteria bacterium]|nr:TonB-dependent receptor [Acidobacteriota bacterium]
MKSVFRRFLPAVSVVCLSFLSFAATSNFAQDLDDVTISGKVSDSNGLPIVGATVTATLLTTGVERTITTNDEGLYRIIELQPGVYQIKSSANNFGAQLRAAFETIAGQNVRLDFTLAPTTIQAEQTITISDDDAPLVDATRTVVGGTVTEREIEELPNNTRSPLDLVFTLGGVAEEPLSVRNAAEDRARVGGNSRNDPRSSPTEAGIFSLSGGTAYSNNLTIDGLDNNDDRLAQERFQPSIDSISEVQVITNQFSAEYGRASGGRVNIRTRAGTKNFRGRAFLYFRDEILDANTFNNNRRTPRLDRLPFTEYNPGFTLGGPIPFGYFKDKTFFFTAYEFNNLLDTTLIDTVVPVVQNPNFVLPVSTGGNPRFELVPVGQTAAQFAPFVHTVATPSRKHLFSNRIDHNFTDTHNVTFSFEYGTQRNTRQFRAATSRLEEAILGPKRQTDAYKFTDNYVFNSNLVNQFRFQFSRFEPQFASSNPTDPVVLIALNDTLSGTDNRGGTLIAGNSTNQTNFNFPGTRKEARFQFQETLNAVIASHSLKFGADVQNIKSDFLDLQDATGTFNFQSVNLFLNNNVTQYRRNFGRQTGQKNTYYGIFIQDEWRAFKNLTVSLGLRFEKETIIGDNNNFGPRAALAYSPFKDGKGVFRIGGGIFFNRVLLRTFDDANLTETRQSYNTNSIVVSGFATTQNFRCYNQGDPSYNNARCQVLRRINFPNAVSRDELVAIETELRQAGVLSGVQTGFSTPANNLRRIDPELKVPESYQFNVGFEREIGNKFVFETNYTFNKTVRLFREFNANPYNLPTGFRDYNDYLVNGFQSPTLRFVNGDANDLNGVSTSGGITTVNLASRNPSAAAGTPISRARLALDTLGRRLGPGFPTQIDQVASTGSSVYNGLTVELRRRLSKLGSGFSASFRAVYTLSKLEDDGVVNTSNPQNIFDFAADFTRSLQDRRHRFALSGTFEMPNWLGGLSLSPLLRLGSSAPFNISNGTELVNDRNLDEVSTDRPNFSGNLNELRFRNRGAPFPQALFNQFTFAPIGSSGNLPRNAGIGPNLFQFDMNISRTFRFTKRLRLRPNVEIGNVLNATVFTFGSEFINFNPLDNAEQIASFEQEFFVPSRTMRPRTIRLGIRLDF